MSRLGSWIPADSEQRLDRLESLAAIRQLPSRYALALDSRNMDALAQLFVPDVRVGKDHVGRDAIKAWYTRIMQEPRISIHFVGNHIIDFDDADHAHGVVYCRDELERPDTGEWEIGTIQYWDTYARVDGEWCFQRRKFLRWYIVDALTRPSRGAGVNAGADPLSAGQLPEAHPTWDEYWQSVGKKG